MQPSSILIIKTSCLGDIVCSLPVLTQLRRLYPDAHLGWVVDHRFVDLLSGHPWIDELFVFEYHKLRFSREMFAQNVLIRRELRLLGQQMRRRAWDVAVDLQSVFKSVRVLARTGARLRIAEFAGLRHLGALFAANRLVAARRPHAVERCLEVAAPLGVTLDAPEFCLPVDAAAAQWARDKLSAAPHPLLILNPGSAREEKRWPPERFGQAVRIAKSLGGDFTALVVGGPADVGAAAVIEETLGGDCLNLAGQTTLKQLVAVAAEADAMFTGDTGPMHIMAALGKPVVALFGPSCPARNGPWGDGHIVLTAPDRRTASITATEAGEAVAGLLGSA